MIIGKLKPVEGTTYVTVSDARTQIRELAKAAGLKLGTFRPKSEGRINLVVPLADGSGYVTALRKVDSDVTVVKEQKADDVSADVLAQIQADGDRGAAKRQADV